MAKKSRKAAAADVEAGVGRNGHDAGAPQADTETKPPAVATVESVEPGALQSPRNGGSQAVSHPAGVDPWRRVRKLAVRQLNRLVSLEPKVLEGDSPKAVHDLRVASRRLQSLLDFLYPSPRPPQIRKVRRRLKQAREVLGELRNQDVLLERMDRVLARKRAARRKAWEAGREYVTKWRSKSAQHAHRRLTRLNLAQVYVRLRGDLASPATSSGQAKDVAPPRPRRVAPEHAHGIDRPVQPHAQGAQEYTAARFAERLAQVWKAFDEMAEKSRRDSGELHAFRIATKRLRYLLEVAAALDVAGSSDALGWLRELQGRLGDWHDQEILDATLIEMLARRKFLRKNLELAIEVEKLILGLRQSKVRRCLRYLRKTTQSAHYRQAEEWVNQFAALPRLTAGRSDFFEPP